MAFALALESPARDNGPRVTSIPESRRIDEAQAIRLCSLMAGYQAGDPAAVDELVKEVNPILSRFYLGLTGNPQHLDDLLQDCWMRIHRARHSYRPAEAVLPWIFAVARHSRVDSYRKWQRTSGRESNLDGLARPPSSDPRQEFDAAIEAHAILRIIDGLPDGQREVITMLKVTGMSVEEVARATGSTGTAVKQKAYRAYQAIRRALGITTARTEESDELRRR